MLTTCIYGHSCMCCYFILFFFFSSRRRHTRYWRDWSSDVCSSDRRVARVMRGAAQEVVERDFVKAAEAVGEKRSRIVFGEVLPNVTSPLLVELGLRMTYSIGLIAAISFLGFGLQPPTADWGLMINENRLSITVQAWAVLLPVLAIGLLTVGTNLVTDGIARAGNGIDRKGRCWAAQPPWTSANCASSWSGRRPTWSTRSRSRARRARCSGWAASPARARPPWGWRCWATFAAGGGSARGWWRSAAVI